LSRAVGLHAPQFLPEEFYRADRFSKDF